VQGQSIALFECSDSRVYFMEALIITKPMGRVTDLSLPRMKKKLLNIGTTCSQNYQ
jgi:hypothetical protein